MTNANRVSRGRLLGRLPRAEDVRQVAQQIPPVIYAFRLADDVIKIGWTTNLDARRRKLGASWDGLLAIKPGTIEDERRLHRRISDAHRHHSIEYYLPTPQIIAMLNSWRRDMGLPPIEVHARSPRLCACATGEPWGASPCLGVSGP